MKTLMVESKKTQMYATQQTHGDGHHGQAARPILTHDEIATRAYDIYVKKGRRQGQCERNWQQAETDLRNERKNAGSQVPQSCTCKTNPK
jgi:hypothetical protein